MRSKRYALSVAAGERKAGVRRGYGVHEESGALSGGACRDDEYPTVAGFAADAARRQDDVMNVHNCRSSTEQRDVTLHTLRAPILIRCSPPHYFRHGATPPRALSIATTFIRHMPR